MIPQHLAKMAERPEKAAAAKAGMLSNAVLSGIPEINLGYDVKIRNIEETEQARLELAHGGKPRESKLAAVTAKAVVSTRDDYSGNRFLLHGRQGPNTDVYVCTCCCSFQSSDICLIRASLFLFLWQGRVRCRNTSGNLKRPNTVRLSEGSQSRLSSRFLSRKRPIPWGARSTTRTRRCGAPTQQMIRP
jgi:hypothetical protein